MTFCGKESASPNWLALSDLLLVSWLLSVYTDVTNPTHLNNGKAIPGNKLVQCGTLVHCVSDVLVFGPCGYVSVRFERGIARKAHSGCGVLAGDDIGGMVSSKAAHSINIPSAISTDGFPGYTASIASWTVAHMTGQGR